MLFSGFASSLILGTQALAAITFKGVDWSSVLVEERGGITYKTTSGQTRPLEQILAASGVNTVRQRVWVNPAGGDYGLEYNVVLAKRAKSAGMGLYLDLHFSDTWADPAHQAIPSGWPRNIESLSWRLYNYTLDVSNRFQAEGLQPRIISIGNEITAGLLFPTGSSSSFGNIARLLHSAAWGIKDSRLNPKPKIMVHLDKGWDWGTQQWFYTTLLRQSSFVLSDFDIMGVSFYPFYGSGATFGALRTTLSRMVDTWGKEVAVVETDWPTSCPAPREPFPADSKNLPFSAAGQTRWMQEVAAVVSQTRNGNGIFYWEPAWIRNANLGSSCADNLMFTRSGQALSSLSVFSTF